MLRLDPTQWLVSVAGFVYDWMITREWRRILLSMIPMFVLIAVAGLVFWGGRLDHHRLASWYLELGEREIKDWENAWAEAPEDAQQATPAPGSGTATNPPQTAEDSPDADTPPQPAEKLSRFAEVLFRRVQMLEPNDRSQFIIGATLAQQGALGQARRTLSKIAPDDSRGYPPAHALLAQMMLRQPLTTDDIPVLMHHITEAMSSARVPLSVLVNGAKLAFNARNNELALTLIQRAAEIDPAHHLAVTTAVSQMAAAAEKSNKKAEANRYRHISTDSAAKAETHFRELLENNRHDVKARLSLTFILAESGRLDEAETLIREGLKLKSTPELVRGLSEIYRLRYRESLSFEEGTWTANLRMLDQALRIDPTNALIAEEIATFVRIGGDDPSPKLMKNLQTFLAEGKATAATHASLAESYLLKNDFEKALPHLEQVVSRLPNAAQYLNNLAFVIADLHPERMQEALDYARRAVAVDPNHPDFHDTLAMIYSKLGQKSKAIEHWESAIELHGLRNPNASPRMDFHQQLAQAYRQSGNLEMAEQHENIVKKIEVDRAKAAPQVENASSSSAAETNDAQAAEVTTSPAAANSGDSSPNIVGD